MWDFIEIARGRGCADERFVEQVEMFVDRLPKAQFQWSHHV